MTTRAARCGVVLRQMRADDLRVAEEISAAAFLESDRRTLPRAAAHPARREPARSARWVERTQGILRTDPDGCWVAEVDEEVVGFATSVVRLDLWVLVTFAVRPGLQGRGIGRALLDRVEQVAAARGCDRALLSASDDPGALRRYWTAGFALHPQLLLTGRVRRTALPAVVGVHDGDLAHDRDWMDDLDRSVRGGPHGPDHDALDAMAGAGGLLVDRDRRGYAWTSATETFVVAARDRDVARRLLWEALGRGGDVFTVSHITTANRWAVDVSMTAGLGLAVRGHLGVRGQAAPAPYVHNGALL